MVSVSALSPVFFLHKGTTGHRTVLSNSRSCQPHHPSPSQGFSSSEPNDLFSARAGQRLAQTLKITSFTSRSLAQALKILRKSCLSISHASRRSRITCTTARNLCMTIGPKRESSTRLDVAKQLRMSSH